MRRQRIFAILGWLMIAGSLLGAVLSYFVINNQDFVVALLARVVEQPFEYRRYLALLTGAAVGVCGCLIGLIYVGLAEVMKRQQDG